MLHDIKLWWAMWQLRSKRWETCQKAAETLGRSGDARAIEPLGRLLQDNGKYLGHIVAVQALAQLGTRRAIDLLVEGLNRQREEGVREAAAIALGRIGDTRAVEPLILALQDEGIDVRKAAAEALGRIGDTQAVEPLILALQDKNKNVQGTAVQALVKLGDAAVEPLMLALQNTDREVQKAAMGALGGIGDKRAVEPLMLALQDQDREVQKRAAEALGWIGDARAVEPLVLALQDEDINMLWTVLRALESLHWEPMDDTQRALRAVIFQRWEEVASLGGAAARPLGMLLKQVMISGVDSHLGHTLLNILKNIRDLRAIDALVELLDVVCLDGWHKAMRQEVIEALERAGVQARESLIQFLKTPGRYGYRFVVKMLEKIGDARAVDALVGTLQERDWSNRQLAAEALGKIGDTRAIAPLVIALQDENWAVLETAVKALELLGWRPKDATQRAQRAVVLGKWQKAASLGNIAVPPLVKALSSNLRNGAAKTLGQIGDAQAVEPLLDVLKSVIFMSWDSSTAPIVAEALGKIGDARAVVPLVIVLGKTNYLPMLEATTKALETIGDAKSVEPLVRAAQVEEKAVRLLITRLREVLKRSAASISAEDLRLVTGLKDLVQLNIHYTGCGACSPRHEPVDCSYVRQLARQELIRRGLQA